MNLFRAGIGLKRRAYEGRNILLSSGTFVEILVPSIECISSHIGGDDRSSDPEPITCHQRA